LAVKCTLVPMTTDMPTPHIRPLTKPLNGSQTLKTIRLNLDQQRIVKDIGYNIESNYETTLDLDSHADTCVLGRDALIILDYN
jgi:hypothetical protein